MPLINPTHLKDGIFILNHSIGSHSHPSKVKPWLKKEAIIDMENGSSEAKSYLVNVDGTDVTSNPKHWIRDSCWKGAMAAIAILLLTICTVAISTYVTFAKPDEEQPSEVGKDQTYDKYGNPTIEDPSDFRVHLSSGVFANEGFVTVQHQGRWGSVCGRDWGDEETIVVCRMLGYNGGQTAFLQGTTQWPVLLSDVKCDITATSLNQCSHSKWGSPSCGHQDAVWITCTGQPNMLQVAANHHIARRAVLTTSPPATTAATAAPGTLSPPAVFVVPTTPVRTITPGVPSTPEITTPGSTPYPSTPQWTTATTVAIPPVANDGPVGGIDPVIPVTSGSPGSTSNTEPFTNTPHN